MLLELLGLRFGALVAPDQRGANDFVVFVEQHGAVHLAGKADARDGFGGETRGLAALCGPRGPRRATSRAGLARPSRVAGWRSCACSSVPEARTVPCFVEDYGAGSAGSHVDAKSSDKASHLLLDLFAAGRDCGAVIIPPRNLRGLRSRSFPWCLFRW